ncbi:putative pyridoxamine 5'-phosphate oxidase [Dictyocaulus viviparus]|uniref:pyridoxal 5'-phosphate synthase n=1 Tax=Dictyocaulus viviparus TaxID=29172 RepID=A0A0D8Y8B8_DICVI|nr:putative pyridoxamine 5'-phosphate oxidase [Dictyocaulus viviparus]
MRPSSRMVLLKSYANHYFTFYTNFNSRKGHELQENPNACMLFYWPRVHRQVRIEGKVTKVPNEDAVAYWNSRPLASRIGSKSSEQSKVVPNREFLLNKQKALEELAEKDGPDSITKPDLWHVSPIISIYTNHTHYFLNQLMCGFALKPDYFEFWQGQSNRLHDRIEFRESDGQWIIQRLSP